jgi:hypothetical protein
MVLKMGEIKDLQVGAVVKLQSGETATITGYAYMPPGTPQHDFYTFRGTIEGLGDREWVWSKEGRFLLDAPNPRDIYYVVTGSDLPSNPPLKEWL